ncbi:hypothetical protein M422DRAFT_228437 [Sphaerobolus stellatus SS14]|uniref:Oxidase ustYa n=1 Tax=Sphaerobolus stellatus (strain SS14) TaxID=990650 RepID=A0A0C9UMX8_SPHS4|nr:hypothetical protein M422DRAFT_228437 [Sphaerobolus stellatus SS14]
MPKAKSTVIYLLVIGWLNVCLILYFLLKNRRTPGPDYTYRAHDFPEYMPLSTDLPIRSMVVEESVHYRPLGRDSDAQWASISPGESGYLRLGPENRLFAVSMFHQLHCLRMINLGFSKAKIASPGHLQHCLNYLRQAALCSADITLEPGQFEEKDFTIERVGATHECRDWEIPYNMMDENFEIWKKIKEKEANRTL